MFNHRFRKSLILIGGSGEFGQRVTRRFAKPFFKKWQVFCIDGKLNPDATANYVIEGLHDFHEQEDDPREQKLVISSDTLDDLAVKLKEVAPEYDAIVNLSGVGRENPLQASLTDGFELFEEYERVRRHLLLSSMLTAHLATHHLSPDGYVLFKSELSAFDHTRVSRLQGKPAILDFVANSAVAKQAMDLATDRTDQQLVWMNATINLLLSEQIISEKQRKNPKEVKKLENKLRGSANLLKYWATGDGRPENGSFVGFRTDYYKSGKVTLPKFY